MNWVNRTLNSSIGCKAVMAVTGIALVGFLLAHLLGNLLVFAGADAINQYAQKLREFLPILWAMRLGLVGFFLIHLFAAIKLTKINREAKPIKYRVKSNVKATFASRYMGLTGAVVLGFVLFHLAHLTFRWTHPEFQNLGAYDVYSMLLASFQNPILALCYSLCIILLMLHLNHGISSLFQTLGLYNSKYTPWLRKFGPSISIFLGLGYLSIPLSIMIGFIK